MKTAKILKKSVLTPGNNWISLLNSAKIIKKNAVTPVNFHLYHYAGNNPVRYTDPDGRDINPHFGCKVVKSTKTTTYDYNKYIEYSNTRLTDYIKAKEKIDLEYNKKTFFDSFASSVSNLDCWNTISDTGSSSGSGFAATIGLINSLIQNQNEEKKEKAEKILNLLFIDVPCLVDINAQMQDIKEQGEILDIKITFSESKEYAKQIFSKDYTETGRCERNIKIEIRYKDRDNVERTYTAEKTISME